MTHSTAALAALADLRRVDATRTRHGSATRATDNPQAKSPGAVKVAAE